MRRTMLLPNLFVLRKPRAVQFLIVVMLMILSLGALRFPRAHAQDAQSVSQSISPISAGINGSLVRACVPDSRVCTLTDLESDACGLDASGGALLGCYQRLTVNAWAIDPLDDGDPTKDYYIYFISVAVQASQGWCLYDGRS